MSRWVGVLFFFLFVVITAANHQPKDYCRTAHGPHNSIRKCCLQYVSCPIHVESGAKKYGLLNSQNYPLYYCKCELSFYKCLSRVDTGRSVSTRKAHFLESTAEGETKLRLCLTLEEKERCSKRFMGICLRQEKALLGSLASISDYIY